MKKCILFMCQLALSICATPIYGMDEIPNEMPILQTFANYPDLSTTPIHATRFMTISEDCAKGLKAATDGDNKTIKELIAAKDGSLFCCTLWGITCLHQASHNGHLEIVKTLTGPDIQPFLDQKGITLHDYVNQADSFGRTPLHFAMADGNPDIIQTLLNRGAEVNKQAVVGGSTALHVAARNGHQQAMQLLLAAQQAHVDIQDGYGLTPLFEATISNQPACVQMLLNANARTDLKGYIDGTTMTPLEWATKNGKKDMARLLDLAFKNMLTFLQVTLPRCGQNNPILQNLPIDWYKLVYECLKRAFNGNTPHSSSKQ